MNTEDSAWESKPTHFARAAGAWAAAVDSVAHPLFAGAFARLVAEHFCEPSSDPSLAQLQELVDEAYRQAVWRPTWYGKHCVPPAKPKFVTNREQYGLEWNTSVSTLLLRTQAGWIVRITGAHEWRRLAAEGFLGPEGPQS